MSAKAGLFEKDGRTYTTLELSGEIPSKYKFTFGLGKARLILDHVEDIRKFVAENSPKK